MNLIRAALRRPLAVYVAVLGLLGASVLATTRMRIDVFPDLNLPVIYVAQPYGGLDPAQMEGFVTSYYEYHFLYITGIEHVESRSVQNMALVKLFFHPGTEMSQALAQTVAYVERSRAFMPPGTVPPFIVRLDAGSVPVGQLVFQSETRPVAQLQDLALFRVRPLFATLPGVSAPPPFGASQRSILVRADPERLRAHGLTGDDLITAVARSNSISPAGNLRTGALLRIAPLNSVVSRPEELEAIPVRLGPGPMVYLRDVARVEDGSDILTAFALANGKRTVYIPVTKRADASTLDVVRRVREAMPRMRAALPDDVAVRFDLDQSVVVERSLRTVTIEAGLGALLTGLMVLLFLRSWRSALVVVTTIPIALAASVLCLWLVGESLNIMTLGGLALAVGVLVDEATVAVENVHAHLERSAQRAEGAARNQHGSVRDSGAVDSEEIGARRLAHLRAVHDAAVETVTPRLLALLAILAVFVPSFLMEGVSRALFVPLSLAVAFAMLASYVLSSTLVPVMCARLFRAHSSILRNTLTYRTTALSGADGTIRTSSCLRRAFAGVVAAAVRARFVVLPLYLLGTLGGLWLLEPTLGRDLFPPPRQGALQLRVRAPDGTRVEETERRVRALLDVAREVLGDRLRLSLAYVGIPPATYPIIAVYQWTNGPHDAIVQLDLTSGAEELDALRTRLRAAFTAKLPELRVTFEPGDIIGQVLTLGTNAPIEVAVAGPNLAANRAYAAKVQTALAAAPGLIDLAVAQSLEYPTAAVEVDRERAGQRGLAMSDVGNALVAATSSTRYTRPTFWRDPQSGVAYQVQVDVPPVRLQSTEALLGVPVGHGASAPILLGDVATVTEGHMPGEYARYNMQRMVTLTANPAPGVDLGRAVTNVRAALAGVQAPPTGVHVFVRGLAPTLDKTLRGALVGLALAIVVVLLLLTAYFQSLRAALVAVLSVSAALLGAAAVLRATDTSLSLPSFMGAIMAVGVCTANAILFVTFAERARQGGAGAAEAAQLAAQARSRPILMTSLAMLAGMVPMALGMGEGSEQLAPLGRAVLGGLAASTLATLFVLPAAFALVHGQRPWRTASLAPQDHEPHPHEAPHDPGPTAGAPAGKVS